MPIPFTCPYCGHSTLAGDQYTGQSGPCAGCGKTVTVPASGLAPTPPQPLGDDPVLRMVLPVGRSGWAIAAGYAGLFSLVCFPAPLAVLFGLLAIRDIRHHPEKHGMGRAIFGLVMGILGTILLAIMLFALASEGIGR